MNLRACIVASVFAALSAAQQAAPTPRATLDRVQEEYRRRNRFRGEEEVLATAAILRDLTPLDSAPAALRREACAFLRDVFQKHRSGAYTFVITAAAARALARLSDDVADVKLLVEAAAEGATSLDGLEVTLESILPGVRAFAQMEWLTAQLGAADPGVRRTAARVLIPCTRPAFLAKLTERVDLVVRAASDADRDTAEAGLRLLGRIPDARAIPPLREATRSQDPWRRLAAAEALGGQFARYDAEPELRALLEDVDPSVREAAAGALGRARTLDSVPALVDRIAKEGLRGRGAVAESLYALTGRPLGPDPGSWRDWLREACPGGRPRLGTPSVAAESRPAYAPNGYVALYGVPILSDRVVFLLDISRSMDVAAGQAGRATALVAARTAVANAVTQFGDSRRFDVVTFSDDVRPLWREGLLPATDDNRKRAVDFLSTRLSDSWSNPATALDTVFRTLNDYDTLFVLSAGAFDKGELSADRLLRLVDRHNRRRRVRIHAVSFAVREDADDARREDDDADGDRFLRRLAARNGGRFVRRGG